MRNIFIAAVFVALGLSTAASASGFRVEAHTGWSGGSVEKPYMLNFTKPMKKSYEDLNYSDGGISYGGAIGYDLDLSEKFFIGVEAGLDGSSVRICNEIDKLTAAAIPVSGPDNPGKRACSAVGRDISTVVRLGLRRNQSKFYVLGGYTNVKSSTSFPDYEYADDEDKLDLESQTNNGWRLGAGYERSFTEDGGLYFKVEYRYSKYSGRKLKDEDGEVELDSDGDAIKGYGASGHALIAGIGYQF